MTNCKKCKHCTYIAHDYCGSGNKWITCDSKYVPIKDGSQDCKNYKVKKK